MTKYKIYAYDNSDYRRVVLYVSALSEEKAIVKAKKLVTRETFNVTEVREE